jgi:hypothetical protein
MLHVRLEVYDALEVAFYPLDSRNSLLTANTMLTL